MPEDIGGGFDGGGSVRWEVVTSDDDPTKYETKPEGPAKKGRKSKGVDQLDGSQFKIILKVPRDGSAAEFLDQFKVKPNSKNEIVLFVNREKRDEQVRVLWQWEDDDAPSQVNQSS